MLFDACTTVNISLPPFIIDHGIFFLWFKDQKDRQGESWNDLDLEMFFWW